MEYQLRITYFDKDDKYVTIVLHEDEMSNFFDKLKQNMYYINEKSKVGFWTNFSNIRHILIIPQQKGSNIEKVAKDKQSCEFISEGDENPKE